MQFPLTQFPAKPILKPIPAMGGVLVKRNRGILFVSLWLIVLLGGAAFGQTGNGHAEPPNTGGLFTDVPRDHWAYADLEYLAARGIITGLPGGRYEGDTALDRYDAAAMISRAIKYMQNNPESVTLEDLNVLKDLIFKVSDDVTILQSQVGTAQSTNLSVMENRIAQNELEISQLSTRLDEIPGSTPSSLSGRIMMNTIIGVTALLLSILGIALTFMIP